MHIFICFVRLWHINCENYVIWLKKKFNNISKWIAVQICHSVRFLELWVWVQMLLWLEVFPHKDVFHWKIDNIFIKWTLNKFIFIFVEEKRQKRQNGIVIFHRPKAKCANFCEILNITWYFSIRFVFGLLILHCT